MSTTGMMLPSNRSPGLNDITEPEYCPLYLSLPLSHPAHPLSEQHHFYLCFCEFNCFTSHVQVKLWGFPDLEVHICQTGIHFVLFLSDQQLQRWLSVVFYSEVLAASILFYLSASWTFWLEYRKHFEMAREQMSPTVQQFKNNRILHHDTWMIFREGRTALGFLGPRKDN